MAEKPGALKDDASEKKLIAPQVPTPVVQLDNALAGITTSPTMKPCATQTKVDDCGLGLV